MQKQSFVLDGKKRESFNQMMMFVGGF